MTERSDIHHQPVMLNETLAALNVQPGGRYIDATAGEGGHSRAILQASSPGGQVLMIDADPEAVTVASERLKTYGNAALVINENFADMRAIAKRFDFMPVHGILFDLGMSSLQLDRETRGFSFRRPDPLDMRFSMADGPTASDIVNQYSENELADLIYRLGDEKASRHIAYAIVQNRPIATSMQLAQVVAESKRNYKKQIHPATQTFQAIRIAVNNELRILETALEQAISLLGYSGRIAVISYHSIEDRIVKNFMRREAQDCICPPEELAMPLCTCKHQATIARVIDKPVSPTEAEIRFNPRSRSAKLRVAERI